MCYATGGVTLHGMYTVVALWANHCYNVISTSGILREFMMHRTHIPSALGWRLLFIMKVLSCLLSAISCIGLEAFTRDVLSLGYALQTLDVDLSI